MAQICQGLGIYRTTGAKLYRPYLLALLAEASGRRGRVDEGLPLLAEAPALVDTNEEGWWAAELYRLQGEAWLQ
jgi:hypothetical protein